MKDRYRWKILGTALAVLLVATLVTLPIEGAVTSPFRLCTADAPVAIQATTNLTTHAARSLHAVVTSIEANSATNINAQTAHFEVRNTMFTGKSAEGTVLPPLLTNAEAAVCELGGTSITIEKNDVRCFGERDIETAVYATAAALGMPDVEPTYTVLSATVTVANDVAARVNCCNTADAEKEAADHWINPATTTDRTIPTLTARKVRAATPTMGRMGLVWLA